MNRYKFALLACIIPCLISFYLLANHVEPVIRFFYAYELNTSKPKVAAQLSSDFKHNIGAWVLDEVYIIRTIAAGPKVRGDLFAFWDRLATEYIPVITPLQWLVILQLLMIPIDMITITAIVVIKMVSEKEGIVGRGGYMNNQPINK